MDCDDDDVGDGVWLKTPYPKGWVVSAGYVARSLPSYEKYKNGSVTNRWLSTLMGGWWEAAFLPVI